MPGQSHPAVLPGSASLIAAEALLDGDQVPRGPRPDPSVAARHVIGRLLDLSHVSWRTCIADLLADHGRVWCAWCPRDSPARCGQVSLVHSRPARLACSASTTGGSSTTGRMMTQRLDPRSDRPLALQLADLLRAEIQEGQRRAGSQLPTESEFQHDYGVSRTTVRAALATLASEGLVLTRKGFGSYVRSRPPLRRVSSTHRHASHRDSGKPEFDTEALAQGQMPSRRMLMTGRGAVPGDIAAWLGVEAGRGCRD